MLDMGTVHFIQLWIAVATRVASGRSLSGWILPKDGSSRDKRTTMASCCWRREIFGHERTLKRIDTFIRGSCYYFTSLRTFIHRTHPVR